MITLSSPRSEFRLQAVRPPCRLKAGLRTLLCALAALTLLSCRNAPAAVTNVTATVTFTNVVRGVTNGDTITINGDVRRYTNGVLASAPLWILSTNIVGYAATNTWLHLAVYTPAGIDRIAPTNTNSLLIVSTFRTNVTLSVALSSGVGTVSYATNVWADVMPVQFPNGALATEAARTNNASGLIGLLNDNRQTNSVNNGVTALSNLIDRTSSQGLGNKAITNSSLDTTRITNAPNIWGSNVNVVTLRATNGALFGMTNSGVIIALTNGAIYYANLVGVTNAGYIAALTNGTLMSNTIAYAMITNATLSGAVAITGAVVTVSGNGVGTWITIISESTSASLGPALQLTRYHGTTNAVASNDVVGHVFAGGYGVTAVKAAARLRAYATETYTDSSSPARWVFETTPPGATATVPRMFIDSNGVIATNITLYGGATIDGLTNVTSFLLTGGVLTNSLAYVTTITNQSTYQLTNGALGWSRLEGNTITNAIHDGTNRWNGDVSFTPRANANPVNGNNANVNIGTNVHVQLSGPTTIGVYCGFLAGRDGDYRILRFTGAVTNTLANESGFEGTAAQRIVTGTGADVSMTNNPSFATLIYDATASRWRVITVSR